MNIVIVNVYTNPIVVLFKFGMNKVANVNVKPFQIVCVELDAIMKVTVKVVILTITVRKNVCANHILNTDVQQLHMMLLHVRLSFQLVQQAKNMMKNCVNAFA